MNNSIIVSADPAGFNLKEEIKSYLIEKGFEVTDVGTLSPNNPVPFYQAAINLSKQVQSGAFERGIVFCGTGMGVSQVCNKFKGIYCAVVESTYTAKKCRIVNNSNVLALGGFVQTPTVAKEIVDVYLATEWCQNESKERTEMFQEYRAKSDEYGDVL